jgi:hypothetical protein
LLARRDAKSPLDNWVFADAFVLESSVRGLHLGESPNYQLSEGAKVLEMAEEGFDERVNDFCMREGYYPDT